MNIDEVAWYSGNCSAKQEVKKLQANELGLYDMSGNVWEWTSTINYGDNQYMRGGSYRNGASYSALSYSETSEYSYTSNSSYGFRLALSF